MSNRKTKTPVEQDPAAPFDVEKVREAIRTTGFNLEFQVSEQFRKAGWGVINNKYYVDDAEGSVREIDLVAYRVETVGGVAVYTTLIVSCKKNEENAWALLSKTPRLNDPNIDWHPQHVWTNETKLNHMFVKTEWVPKYLDICKAHSVYDELIAPARHIFAFQEINKTKAKYTCQNDKNIFGSISSLMKAQGYEIGALKVRKTSKNKSVYWFGLITVVDTELVCIDYGQDGSTHAQQIDEERYIGSYIINQKEIAARIHFVTAESFSKVLARYNTLHQCNAELAADLTDDFYVDLIEDDERASLVDEAFNRAVHGVLNREIRNVTNSWEGREFKARKPTWLLDSDVEVYGAKGTDIDILKSSATAKQIVTAALREHYRYQGPWKFSEEIPF
jgi:hypothetical protein